MDENDNGRGRLARIVLAVALAVIAIRSLRNGKRVTGVLAGVGAGALGYSATAEDRKPTEEIDVEMPGEDDSVERTGTADSTDTTGEDGRLRCAVCGKPIVPGQIRGPNADHEIVHRDCMDPSQ